MFVGQMQLYRTSCDLSLLQHESRKLALTQGFRYDIS